MDGKEREREGAALQEGEALLELQFDRASLCCCEEMVANPELGMLRWWRNFLSYDAWLHFIEEV